MFDLQDNEEKTDLILEMWSEGWELNDMSTVIDEIKGLHMGEKPMWKFTQEEIDGEYERALEWKKELMWEQGKLEWEQE